MRAAIIKLITKNFDCLIGSFPFVPPVRYAKDMEKIRFIFRCFVNLKQQHYKIVKRKDTNNWRHEFLDDTKKITALGW